MSARVLLIEALTEIPRITVEQWRTSPFFVRWMIASRAAVLVMTFSSVAAGGALALLNGTFDGPAWLLCLFGLLAAHAANNQLNDLTDFVRGIDEGNYFRNQYGTHVLEHGLLTTRQLAVMFAATGVAALAIGLLLVARTGTEVLWPLGAGAFFLLAYTYPLKQWGLGELAVLLVWGPLMVGGTYLVTTGEWSNGVAMIGVVHALGPTIVIFGKHIDKLDFDREKNVRTLPVRLGERASRYSVVAMVALQYLGVVTLTGLGWLPWPALLTLAALPQALRMVRVYASPRPEHCPADYPAHAWPLWYVSFAFVYARAFGLALLAGLMIGWLLD